jgi:hypothetical protein
MSIAVTHKAISGQTMQCSLCVVLPSDLRGGMIVLEGFVGKILRSELGSAQEVEVRDRNQHVVLFPVGTT